MATARNAGRINVWPHSTTARSAAHDAPDCESLGRMTIYSSTGVARTNDEHENWVPAGGRIHIDFLGGTPQGRAWVHGTGEVAIETLLGNDPAVDASYADGSAYLSADLMADGYLPSGTGHTVTCFLDLARSRIMAGATIRYQFKNTATVTAHTIVFAMSSADGADALELDLFAISPALNLSSWGGPVSGSLAVAPDVIAGHTNCLAFTTAGMRFEATLNGNAGLLHVTLVDADRPAANPLDGVSFDFRGVHQAIQSITIYDPLPTTDGLVELSEPFPDSGASGDISTSSGTLVKTSSGTQVTHG